MTLDGDFLDSPARDDRAYLMQSDPKNDPSILAAKTANLNACYFLHNIKPQWRSFLASNLNQFRAT